MTEYIDIFTYFSYFLREAFWCERVRQVGAL